MKKLNQTFQSRVMSVAVSVVTVLVGGTCFGADVTGDRLKIGLNPSVTGTYATIAGGERNTNAGLWGVISGGIENRIPSTYDSAVIGGGAFNYLENHFTTVAGGINNAVYGEGGTIGGGNANRVFLDNVYGMSTIAGGEGNRTYSYYCTVGGGNANYATNYGSTIAGGIVNTAGGGSATVGGGTANRAFADNSFVGGGYFNLLRVTAEAGTLGGGYYNTNDGPYSTIGGGAQNMIMTNGGQATIAGGQYNVANAAYASVPGGLGAVASHYGQVAHASGRFASYSTSVADAQSSMFVLRQTSSSTNKVELFLDGVGERLTIPVGATWLFDLLIVARSATGNSSGWQVRGVIENVGGTVSKIGTFPKTAIGEDVTSWAVDINADNVNDCLSVKATGDTSNIRWVATVRTAEVSY